MDEIDHMMQNNQRSNECKEMYRKEGKLTCRIGNSYSRSKCIEGYDDCEDRVKR